jgi:hypothetical protein
MMAGTKIPAEYYYWSPTHPNPVTKISMGSSKKYPLPTLPSKTGEDSIYIFMDTDNDDTTGYHPKPWFPIGAEYMIEFKGQNGDIISSLAYKYSGYGLEDFKWNGLNHVLSACDNRQLEAQIDLNNLGLIDSKIEVYVYMTDWKGAQDSFNQPLDLELEEPKSNPDEGYGIRGNTGVVDYTDSSIDPIWTSISPSWEGSITDQDEGGIPNQHDINASEVCDNMTWINFYVSMHDNGNPFDRNIGIYIDEDNDGNDEWCIYHDLTLPASPFVGTILYQWNVASWLPVTGAQIEYEKVNGEIEIGVNLTSMSLNPGDTIYYNVTTEPDTAFPDQPAHPNSPASCIDWAPDSPPAPSDHVAYTITPEFETFLIPIIAILIIGIVIRKRRRNNHRARKKEVNA